MLIEMGMRGLVFLLLAACSNDQFNGEEAGVDAEAGPAQEAAAEDVFEAAVTETGPKGFCGEGSQSGAFFCDDFDTLPNPTDSFSVTTPSNPPTGTFAFGAGKTGKGLVVTASGLVSSAYVTKQVQGPVLKGFTFAIQIAAAAASVTYVEVQAQSSTFVVAADTLGQNITIKGDSGNAQNAFKPDGSWHVFDVQIVNGNANVAVDGAAPIAVPFSASGSSSSSFEIGIVTAALAGGAVTFDDVALR